MASANSTTFVRFGSAAVNGTAGNAVQPIIDGAAMQVAVYTVDTTAPVLLSFDLNMRDGNVVLVEVASADCRLISFSTAADNVIDRDLG